MLVCSLASTSDADSIASKVFSKRNFALGIAAWNDWVSGFSPWRGRLLIMAPCDLTTSSMDRYGSSRYVYSRTLHNESIHISSKSVCMIFCAKLKKKVLYYRTIIVLLGLNGSFTARTIDVRLLSYRIAPRDLRTYYRGFNGCYGP